MLTYTEIIRWCKFKILSSWYKDIYIPCSSFAIFAAGCVQRLFWDVDQTESISAKRHFTLFNIRRRCCHFRDRSIIKFLDFNMSTFSWNGMAKYGS
jgi:hypothetical protein